MKIKIKGEYYNVTLPCQRIDTHEGGLNSANVEIRHITRKEPFEPFSFVEFDGDTWVIDSDKVTYEPMINRYTHIVSLCEEVKELEKIICGAKTFSIPKDEKIEQYTSLPEKTIYNASVDSIKYYDADYFDELKTPYITPSFKDIGGKAKTDIEYNILANEVPIPFGREPTTEETDAGCAFYYKCEYSTDGGSHFESIYNNTIIEFSENLIIRYKFTRVELDRDYPNVGLSVRDYTYIFKIASSIKSLRKNLTVFEAANRLLYTYEAHSTVEVPLYKLNGSSGEWIRGDMILGADDDILCPELSFANGATLKENLDQLASILHAKVRMRNGVIYFERLTKQEKSYLPKTEIDGADSFNSDKYGGEVQTFVQNVVNYNEGAGTVTNLFAKTIRSEEGKVRIGEDGGLISTEYPIEKIVKVLYVSQTKNEDGTISVKEVDITEKVVESTYYNTLSSFEGSFSKNQFIYYTQGQKNIKGLFYKANSLTPEAFEPTSIQNILNPQGINIGVSDYKDLLFKVSYIAICNLRASFPRPDGKGGRTSYILNQSENRTDANNFGRKMYATALQLTSNSPQKTYIINSGGRLPVVGKQFDKDNYISQMSVEHFPTFSKATINISENYNKLNDFVSVHQAIRQYEIDINNVQERHVLYKDWCLIGFKEDKAVGIYNQSSFNNEKIKALIIAPFSGLDTIDYRVKAALAITFAAPSMEYGISNLQGIPGAIKGCILPAIAVGLGNSLLFSFKYEDNYSAGSQAIYFESLKQYNEQRYVRYSDNYGNADLIKFEFINGGESVDPVESGKSLPEKTSDMKIDQHIVTISGGYKYDKTSPYGAMQQKVHLYKDPRETIIIEYQLLFGSNEGIIVGADYCETNPLVRKNEIEGETSVLCFYDHLIDQIQGTTEIPDDKNYRCNVFAFDKYITPETGFAIPHHKSWAIIRGGKFLLGKNSEWETENGDPKKLYFRFTHRREY